MDEQQNATIPTNPNTETTTQDVATVEDTDFIYDQYLSFKALQGLSITPDGEMEIWSESKFAEYYKVNRSTTWRWRQDANFWNLVHSRHDKLMRQEYTLVAWQGVLLRAAKGDKGQAEMILTHFGNYVPPTQKHEVKLTGWADVIRETRRPDRSGNTKAIDATTSD